MEKPDVSTNAGVPLALFEAYGVELEYMIVDRDTLSVRPLCDQLLQRLSGTDANEIFPDGVSGPVAWSNELALHVIEFKVTPPPATLTGLDRVFAAQVRRANALLSDWNACLLPGAMHPWMDPLKEMRLWPHGNREIYETFNRIFDCHGHGWANLQSVHLNLPFADNMQFFRLHTAIRALLPLLPALAASSPIMGGNRNGLMDNRLDVYRHNCARIPAITGKVIPEAIRGRDDYMETILLPIYHALAPLDPEGILCHEWVNARGAIVRFDRGAIEIRLLDIQESPKADMAILELIRAVLRALVQEELSTVEEQFALVTDDLHAVLLRAMRDGDAARVAYPPLLRCLDISESDPVMGEVWRCLAERTLPADDPAFEALHVIFREGCLARRIGKAMDANGGRSLFSLYSELRGILANNQIFHG